MLLAWNASSSRNTLAACLPRCCGLSDRLSHSRLNPSATFRRIDLSSEKQNNPPGKPPVFWFNFVNRNGTGGAHLSTRDFPNSVPVEGDWCEKCRTFVLKCSWAGIMVRPARIETSDTGDLCHDANEGDTPRRLEDRRVSFSLRSSRLSRFKIFQSA